MTKEEAKNKVSEIRPNYKIISVKELDNCFVVEILPNNFDENSGDLYIGGALRVDKKTGKIGQFNPILENMR